jgi:hypothetical protein
MTTHRASALLAACVCALLAAACGPGFDMTGLNAMVANAQAVQQQQGTLSGQLVAGTAAQPAWTFEPAACKSGQNDGFYGVDLASLNPSAVVVRLVQDPIQGARVRIQRQTPHGLATQQLERSQCTVLDLKVDRENVAFNHVTALDGSLAMDCQVDGQNIAGTLHFQGCHQSAIVDAATASLGDTGAADGAVAHVPDTAPVASLPPELTGLSVRLDPQVVGVLLPGDTMEHARAQCFQGDVQLVHQMGWRVVTDGSPADLVARIGCTGHVVFAVTGHSVRITVPHDGTPSLVLSSGDHVIATVPTGATQLLCESSAQDPETDCARRASAAAAARIANVLAGSTELRAFVQQRRGSGH